MKWNDLIESIMTNNNGTASLSFLYDQAAKYGSSELSVEMELAIGMLQ